MASKRKNRGYKRDEPFRDATLFLIVTEGEISEKIYFEGFRSNRIKVRVVPSEDGKSAPVHVLANVNLFIKGNSLESTDQVYLVIDRDRWPEKQLAAVAKECETKSYNLILSNPCFEFWLFLHLFEYDTALNLNSCDNYKKFLSDKIEDYSYTNYDPEPFINQVEIACSRAEDLDDPSERWPNSSGSRIYLLVREILVVMN